MAGGRQAADGSLAPQGPLRPHRRGHPAVPLAGRIADADPAGGDRGVPSRAGPRLKSWAVHPPRGDPIPEDDARIALTTPRASLDRPSRDLMIEGISVSHSCSSDPIGADWADLFTSRG
jgi:hypothetical protein